MRSEGQPGAGPLDQAAATARFATTAKAHRSTAALTQGQVAHASGLDVAEVSRLERGLRDPQLWTIVRLARGLGVEPGDLMDGLR